MEGIDYQKVKDFYNNIAENAHGIDLTLIAAACPDNPPGFLLYRDKSQKRHFFRIIRISKDWTVLDLGCGTGRWALTFGKKAGSVVGIDNSQKLLDLGKQEAKKRSIFNVLFLNSSIIDFSCAEKFNLVFIGSVLEYINDNDLLRVIDSIKRVIKPKGRVVFLEPISASDKIIKNAVYDKNLGTTYSAIYRRSEEYNALFTQNGFKIKYENDAVARNLPIFIYNHFVPAFIKKNKLILILLKWGLNIQAYLDSYLLKFNILKNKAEIRQKFFMYQYLKEKA